MAAANYYSAVQKAYIAFYGRPADKVGLEYWAGQLDTANGNLSTIINAFGTSAEALALFGSQTDTVAIDSLYQQLFGRSADVEGLVYYGTELAAGRMTLVDIAQRIADGATGSDATTIANKLTVAQSFTDALDTADEIINYSGTAAATSARTFLSGVTDDTTTVTTATAAIPATLTSIVTVGDTTTAAGSTFTLTTGTNSFTGTAGDDTFDAGISTSSLQTFNSGDSLDGGDGNDILYAVVTGSVTPAAVKNVETVNLTNTTTAATVDLSNATGLSAVNNSASTVGLTISGISSSGPTVTVRDTAIAGQVVVFNDVTGSADSATVVLNNMGSGSSLTVAGVETLTLQSEGNAANVLGSSAVAGLITANTKNLNITGPVGLTVATTGLLPTTNLLPSTIVNLDASGNTSTTTGINVSLGATAATTIVGGAGNDTFRSLSTGNDSISLGAGNDTYTNVSGFTVLDTIDGGDGTDTLVSTSALIVAASAATPTTYTVTDIETISISDSATAASYTPANISTATTTLNVLGATLNNVGVAVMADGVTMTVVGPAGDFTLGLGNTTTTGALGVIGTVGAQGGETLTISDTGTATTDSLTIVNRGVDATTGAQLNMFNTAVIGVTGYETVTINNGSVGSVAQLTGAITLTGDSSATTTLKLTGANVITTGAITANVIDASGLTAAGTAIGAGTAAFTMAGTNTATTITGSAGIDNLIGHSSSASSIDGGAGVDSIVAGSGNDTVLGGAGNDTITAGSGNDSIDAGDGDDVIIMAANLASGDVINGGEGTDTVLVSAAIAAAAASTITNIEVVGFSADASQDMTAFLNAGVTTLAATAGTLTVTNAQTDLTSLVVGVSGAGLWTGASVTRLVDGSADALSILVVDGSTAPTVGTASFADEETLTIGEYGTDSTAAILVALGTVTATDLKTLNITGSNNHTMTLSGETNLATVNASTATGTLSILGGNSTVNMIATGPTSTAMTIVGGSGNDSITGGGAADNLTGGSGSDTLVGGAGSDTIAGGLGADSLVGGEGTDTLDVSATLALDGGTVAATGVAVNLSTSAISATTIAGYIGNVVAVNQLNSDVSSVAAGTTTYLGAVATVSSRIDTVSGFEIVTGGAGKDYIVGSTSANTITGGAGADVMTGGSGADTFVQGVTDSIIASASDTTLGASNTLIDNLDTFTFGNGVDIVTDFSSSDFLDMATAGTTYTTLDGFTAATVLVASTHYFVQGTYVASTGVFTVNTAATSATANYATMIIEGTGVTAANSVTTVILVGTVASDLSTANFV